MQRTGKKELFVDQDAWMPWNSTTNRQAAPPSPSSNRPIRTALRRHAASESQKSRAISNSESPPSNHHIATPSSTSRTPSSDSHKPRAVASSSRLIPPATPQGRTSDTQKRNAVFSRKQTISSAAGNSDASKNGVVSAKHSPAGSCPVASKSQLTPPAVRQGRTIETQKRDDIPSRKQTISAAVGNSDTPGTTVLAELEGSREPVGYRALRNWVPSTTMEDCKYMVQRFRGLASWEVIVNYIYSIRKPANPIEGSIYYVIFRLTKHAGDVIVAVPSAVAQLKFPLKMFRFLERHIVWNQLDWPIVPYQPDHSPASEYARPVQRSGTTQKDSRKRPRLDIDIGGSIDDNNWVITTASSYKPAQLYAVSQLS